MSDVKKYHSTTRRCQVSANENSFLPRYLLPNDIKSTVCFISIFLGLVLPSECVLPNNENVQGSMDPAPPDHRNQNPPGEMPLFPSRFLIGAYPGDIPPGLDGYIPNFAGAFAPQPVPGPRPNPQAVPRPQQQAPRGNGHQQGQGPRPHLQGPRLQNLQGARPRDGHNPRQQPHQGPRYPQPQAPRANNLLAPGGQPAPHVRHPNPSESLPQFPQRHLLGSRPGDIPPGIQGHRPVFAQAPMPQPLQGAVAQPNQPSPGQMPRRPERNDAPPPPGRRHDLREGASPAIAQGLGQSGGADRRPNLARGARPQPLQNLGLQPAQNLRPDVRLQAAHVLRQSTPQGTGPQPTHGFWPPRNAAQPTCPLMCRPGQLAGEQCSSHPNCRCTIDLQSRTLAHLPCVFISSG